MYSFIFGFYSTCHHQLHMHYHSQLEVSLWDPPQNVLSSQIFHSWMQVQVGSHICVGCGIEEMTCGYLQKIEKILIKFVLFYHKILISGCKKETLWSSWREIYTRESNTEISKLCVLDEHLSSKPFSLSKTIDVISIPRYQSCFQYQSQNFDINLVQKHPNKI